MPCRTVADTPKPRPRVPTRVFAPGVGVSVRTRLRLDPDERALLAAVGAHLTQARNNDLAAARRGEQANDRYKVLVEQFGIRSRYAGTLWVDNDAATKAKHLWRHRAGLRRAVATLERRTAATPHALSTPTVLATRHEGASVAIGRRALGHGLTTRAGRAGPGGPNGRPLTWPRPPRGPATANHRSALDSPPGAHPDHREWSRLEGCRSWCRPGIVGVGLLPTRPTLAAAPRRR